MDEVSEMKEAIDLLYWTLVDAVEMNPDMGEEVDRAWNLVLEKIA